MSHRPSHARMHGRHIIKQEHVYPVRISIRSILIGKQHCVCRFVLTRSSQDDLPLGSLHLEPHKNGASRWNPPPNSLACVLSRKHGYDATCARDCKYGAMALLCPDTRGRAPCEEIVELSGIRGYFVTPAQKRIPGRFLIADFLEINLSLAKERFSLDFR